MGFSFFSFFFGLPPSLSLSPSLSPSRSPSLSMPCVFSLKPPYPSSKSLTLSFTQSVPGTAVDWFSELLWLQERHREGRERERDIEGEERERERERKRERVT